VKYLKKFEGSVDWYKPRNRRFQREIIDHINDLLLEFKDDTGDKYQVHVVGWIDNSPYVWILASRNQDYGITGYKFKKHEVEDIVNNISSYLKDIDFDVKVEWYKDSVYIRF
jgi:predicted secreted protein